MKIRVGHAIHFVILKTREREGQEENRAPHPPEPTDHMNSINPW